MDNSSDDQMNLERDQNPQMWSSAPINKDYYCVIVTK